MAEPRRDGRPTGFAGNAFFFVAGVVLGAAGWALVYMLIVWIFEGGPARLGIPFGVMTVFAALLAREPRLRPLAAGIVLGTPLPVLWFLGVIASNGG
jgi:hypothetical protein